MNNYTLHLMLDYSSAKEDVPPSGKESAEIVERIKLTDKTNIGCYGHYNSLYEVKRDEFYIMILNYLK